MSGTPSSIGPRRRQPPDLVTRSSIGGEPEGGGKGASVGTNGALRWRDQVPLSRHPAFATEDPELAMAGGTDLLAPHRLGLPAGAEGFVARVNARRWRDVMLAYF